MKGGILTLQLPGTAHCFGVVLVGSVWGCFLLVAVELVNCVQFYLMQIIEQNIEQQSTV